MPIKKKRLGINFPSNFIENVFNSFKRNEDFKALNWLFQEKDKSKFFYLVSIPCKKIELLVFRFTSRSEEFRNTNVNSLLYGKREIFKVFFH